MRSANDLQKVRAFWNTEACGTHFVQRFADEGDFFSKYREFRYRTERHIPAFASFAQAGGKRVLEIGCGNGADGVMFASHGAHYVGVDLTPEAIDATKRHFAAEGLDGQFQLENGERLSFADDSFDIVYSYGVLHHTPAPRLAPADPRDEIGACGYRVTPRRTASALSRRMLLGPREADD